MCMLASVRTTIEIDAAHRAELLKLAAQRGEKGFSGIVREALDLYVRQHRAKRQLVEQALALRGSFSGDEANEMEASIADLRRKWR